MSRARFAALIVVANNRFVAAPDILRVNRQIRHFPKPIRILLLETFVDGVLMTAAKRGEHQIARIRMALVNAHARSALVNFADAWQI